MLSTITLCLSIMSIQGNEIAHVPENIQSITQSRILTQMKRVFPKHKIEFNNNECTEKLDYYYDSQSIIIYGENAFWKGRLQASINEVLDGRHLAIENYARGEQIKEDLTHDKIAKTKWWPWILGTLAVAVVSGAVIAINKKSSSNSRPASNGPIHVPSNEGPGSNTPTGPQSLK